VTAGRTGSTLRHERAERRLGADRGRQNDHDAPRGRAGRGTGAIADRRLGLLLGGCAGLAALSLLLPWALAFDPLAWLVWGRDLTRGGLDTSAGPSWKPLPVLLTTPFALAGDAAPALWLLVARTGALLALAGAARLAARLGGPAAGAGAALALALGPWWAFNAALGNSEGLLAACVLWALVAQGEARPRLALALGVAAGLLRPEAWPFVLLYAGWLWREGVVPAPRLAAALSPLPLLWLGPDLIGAGGAFAASHHALGPPSAQSAGNAAVPALAVLVDAAQLLTLPATLAALFAGRRARLLGAAALGWVALVAVQTQAGYAGNPRYLVAAGAVGAVLAGVGAARLGRWPGALVLVAAVAVASLGELRDQAREIEARERSRQALERVVDAAGGAPALRACARVRTSLPMRTAVAWTLDVPLLDLDLPPRAPVVLLRARAFGGRGPAPDVPAGLALAARAPGWEIWRRCS